MVARDQDGEFVFVRSKRYDGVTNPEAVEMLTCRDALAAARELAVQNLLLETDCLNIKQLWDSTAGERTDGYHVMCEM